VFGVATTTATSTAEGRREREKRRERKRRARTRTVFRASNRRLPLLAFAFPITLAFALRSALRAPRVDLPFRARLRTLTRISRVESRTPLYANFVCFEENGKKRQPAQPATTGACNFRSKIYKLPSVGKLKEKLK